MSRPASSGNAVEADAARANTQGAGWVGRLVTLARGSPSLFFVKANYFLVGLVLAAVSLVWSGCLEWRRMAAMAAGFCAAALPFLAYLRFHAGAVLADLQTAANARGGQLSPRLACRCSWRIYRAW